MFFAHLLADGGTAGEDEENKGQVHISSPIRVSPDRKKSRGKCSPHKNEQGKREKKLSVKERLYVSKNTIGLFYVCTQAVIF